MAKLSALIQFILGLLLAVMFMLGGGVAAALYLAAKHSAHPERPVFEEEKVATQPQTTAAKPSANPTPQATATPTQEVASDTQELEPGAYLARVSWPQGLVLRDSPSYESNTIGGIPFNGRIVILEETADKEWQRVRVEGSDAKGWVKGGNTERLAE